MVPAPVVVTPRDLVSMMPGRVAHLVTSLMEMVPRMPAPRVAPVVSAGLFWTVTSQPGSEPTISTVSLQFSSLLSPQVLRSEPGL